jgi:hypothetical protein
MDIIKNKKLNITIVTILLVSIGMCLSGNTLAANATTAQLAAETAARRAADTAERNARTAADNGLNTGLTTEQNARIAADAAESAARSVADTAEASARQAAIQSAITPLQTQINTNALPPLPAGQFQVSLTRCGNSNTLQWGACYYAVGDTGPAGGIVFYITAGGMHGLEAAPEDQSSNAPWGCVGTSIAGAQGSVVGTGAANTAAIVAGCAAAGTAAKVASAYTLNGYSDWFLPSIDELTLMYSQRTVIGGFASQFYWSSSEITGATAWVQGFASPSGHLVGSKPTLIGVRAARAF